MHDRPNLERSWESGDDANDDAEETEPDAGEDTDDSDACSYVSYVSEAFSSAGEREAYERYEQRSKERRLIMEKRSEDETFAQLMEHEKKMEANFDKAYPALEDALLKSDKGIPIGPLDCVAGGRIDLYSSEYLTFYASEFHSHQLHLSSWRAPGSSEPNTGQLGGHLNVYPQGYVNFDPFYPPTHASLEPVVIHSVLGQQIEVTFLGKGYLKVTVELDLLLHGKSAPPPATLSSVRQRKMIEFCGIFISHEEWKRGRPTHRTFSPSIGEQMATHGIF